MKTFYTFFLIMLFISFSACNQNAKAIPEKEQQQEVLKDTVSQKVNAHESEIIKNSDLTSKLAEKVSRLAQLEHNYLLKNLDIVTLEKTLLLGRLKRVLKLRDSLSKTIDLVSIKSEIHEIRKSFLKATKPMYPNENTYPRVTIEEYIFNNQKSATLAFNTLINAKKNGSLWTYVSKEPSVFFLEKNKLYFVSSGGYYMMNIYEKIVEKVRN